MPVAYSKDLRTRVIATWEAKQESQRQLAERFKVSLSYVQRVLRCYRQTGQTEAKPRGATLQPKISPAHLDVVQSLVDQHLGCPFEGAMRTFCRAYRDCGECTNDAPCLATITVAPQKKRYMPVSKKHHEYNRCATSFAIGLNG